MHHRVLEMARSIRTNRRHSRQLRRPAPYPLPHCYLAVPQKSGDKRKAPSASERKDWEDATCSVCMEFPHNAVLLLCSSHDKGCRPYMCGTSYRHSNCLDQFKKAYAKAAAAAADESGENSSAVLDALGWPVSKKSEGMDLACPLCRGHVKGWTVVEPARRYLNRKKRSCMQEKCSFVGTFKELRKHVKADHPSVKPRKVDPVLEQKWRAMERQREHEDVISIIRSSNPRSLVLGDYVIEMDDTDADSGQDFVGRGGRPLGGFSSSFFYFLLREGIFSARSNRDGDAVAADGREARGASIQPMEILDEGEEAGYFSTGDDDLIRPGREVFRDMMRADRRRRRRRSRARSASGLS